MVRTEHLISLVRPGTYLYTPSDPQHKDRRKRDQGWLEIAKELYPQWDLFSKKQADLKLKALQTRWRSTKDSFNSHLKKERSMRSGSAAMSFTPYSYAKDLDFLRPILEMRSTDTCWDDEPAEEDSSAQNTGAYKPRISKSANG